MPEKQYLFTPGPTPVPPQVLAALAEPVLHHRSSDFRPVYERCLAQLQEVHRTSADVLMFTASGTAAMESVAANLAEGSQAVVVSAGSFGERWEAILAVHGAEVDVLRYEWGETPRADDLAARLAERSGTDLVFVTQSETSTGVVADVQALAAAAKSAGALVAVDAVSSLGAVPLEMDAWGLDAVASGSQKALMTPPGLAFCAVSEQALAASKASRSFYLDWRRTQKAQAQLDAPFTPATSLVVALDVALGLLLEEGLEAVFDRHVRLGRATRAGAKAMGLELFSPDEDRSAVVTAIRAPEGIDSSDVVSGVRKRFGMTIANGQGHLKGKIFRIGHIGWFDIFDITTALAAVELVLVGPRRRDRARRSRDRRARGVRGQRVRRMKVLVRESISDAGVDFLRSRFDVDVELDGELADIIGGYDAIVVRSATKLTAELIDLADRLKVIGRAGVGVDNVDVEAATRRGIVVANAPESTVVSAAEHTIGLLVALARNIPQAHAALKQGRWERKKYGGTELAGKTLGVLGFGRIGQQVGRRALGLGMRVVAYDPYVTAERFRELGAEQLATPEDVYDTADFLTLHLPLTPETRGSIDAAAFARMRPGVRLVNAARGELIDEPALIDALQSGNVAGAALDVFSAEPYSGPLLELDNVVVTPHLAASTDEAQDRAGVIVAEQVAAALEGGLVTNAVNIPVIGAEDLEVLGPFVPLAAKLGRLAMELAEGRADQIVITAYGGLADYDTRLLTVAALNGAFQGRADRPVNYVNAPMIARERGIEVREERSQSARDYTNLLRVEFTIAGEQIRLAGTTIGSDNRLWLVNALGFDLEIELAPLLVFCRYDDVPGVIGRVGTLFGEAGVNIANMTVSRSRRGGKALMVLSVDSEPPPKLVERIRAEGFDDARVLSLGPL